MNGGRGSIVGKFESGLNCSLTKTLIMTSNNLAFLVISNTSNTPPTAVSNSVSDPALPSSDVHGVDLTSLAGIPVLLPGQSGFRRAIATWSLHHQPTVHTDEETYAVVRPQKSEDVVRVVGWARARGLQIVPRSGGVGGASGRGGICLDMSGFNHVELDEGKKACTIGSGQTWSDVNAKLRNSEYSVLGARVPFIGVGGYLLCAGLSWLSHEHGIANDPGNLVGATVVLADGRIVKGNNENVATPEERDLMFSLDTYSTLSSLDQFSALSPLLANHVLINPLPTLAWMLMIMDFGRAIGSTKFVPMMSVIIYDALGKSRARTHASVESGFSWLWETQDEVDNFFATCASVGFPIPATRLSGASSTGSVICAGGTAVTATTPAPAVISIAGSGSHGPALAKSLLASPHYHCACRFWKQWEQ